MELSDEGFVRLDDGEIVFQYWKSISRGESEIIRLTPEFIESEKESQRNEVDMKLTYTALPEEFHPQTYEVTIRYNHGDADFSTVETVMFPQTDISEEQLIAYIKKFKEVSDMIDWQRSGGDLVKHYRDIGCEVEPGWTIEIQKDQVFEGSGVYAAMEIKSIVYYSRSQKYSVTWA